MAEPFYVPLATRVGEIRAYLEPPDRWASWSGQEPLVYFRADWPEQPDDDVWFNLKLKELSERTHRGSISTQWDPDGLRLWHPAWGEMSIYQGEGVLITFAQLDKVFAAARELGKLAWPAIVWQPQLVGVRDRPSALAERVAA